jgi:hypothetical protein
MAGGRSKRCLADLMRGPSPAGDRTPAPDGTLHLEPATERMQAMRRAYPGHSRRLLTSAARGRATGSEPLNQQYPEDGSSWCRTEALLNHNAPFQAGGSLWLTGQHRLGKWILRPARASASDSCARDTGYRIR